MAIGSLLHQGTVSEVYSNFYLRVKEMCFCLCLLSLSVGRITDRFCFQNFWKELVSVVSLDGGLQLMSS